MIDILGIIVAGVLGFILGTALNAILGPEARKHRESLQILRLRNDKVEKLKLELMSRDRLETSLREDRQQAIRERDVLKVDLEEKSDTFEMELRGLSGRLQEQEALVKQLQNGTSHRMTSVNPMFGKSIRQ